MLNVTIKMKLNCNIVATQVVHVISVQKRVDTQLSNIQNQREN